MSEFFTNYKRPPNVRTHNRKESLALQQFRDECDINNLVERYHRTGTFYSALDCAGRVARMPQFGDFTALGDFREQQQKIIDVYEMFSQLPAKVRERFNNNPAFFVEFVGNEQNYDECVKLGLFEKKMPEPAAVVPTTGDGQQFNNPVEKKEEKKPEEVPAS